MNWSKIVGSSTKSRGAIAALPGRIFVCAGATRLLLDLGGTSETAVVPEREAECMTAFSVAEDGFAMGTVGADGSFLHRIDRSGEERWRVDLAEPLIDVSACPVVAPILGAADGRGRTAMLVHHAEREDGDARACTDAKCMHEKGYACAMAATTGPSALLIFDNQGALLGRVLLSERYGRTQMLAFTPHGILLDNREGDAGAILLEEYAADGRALRTFAPEFWHTGPSTPDYSKAKHIDESGRIWFVGSYDLGWVNPGEVPTAVITKIGGHDEFGDSRSDLAVFEQGILVVEDSHEQARAALISQSGVLAATIPLGKGERGRIVRTTATSAAVLLLERSGEEIKWRVTSISIR